MTRVLVCGGREFDDWWLLNRVLTDLLVQSGQDHHTIMQGGAKGADFLAKAWAKYRRLESDQIDHIEFPADWRKHGKAAGPTRNQQMLEEGKPDVVVAFQGGRGTQDMVRRARKAGVEVLEI